jgi:hypothetical protein
MLTFRLSSAMLLTLALGLLVVPLAAAPPTRRVIKRTPAATFYAYENAAGETVEEMENLQGKIINRRFYRPAPPACAYVRSVDLETERYWRDEGGEPCFHCLSPMKELGTVADPYGLGRQNNLAYDAGGDAERIHEMMLMLHIHQQHEAKQAHQELLRAAKVLIQQALNTPLPKAAERAILAGTPWQGTVKEATIVLTRDNWLTSKGYNLTFLVRPTGQTCQ